MEVADSSETKVIHNSTCKTWGPQSVFLSNIPVYKITAHKNISLIVPVNSNSLLVIPHSNLNLLTANLIH
jgi:hypothetical protein